MKGSSLDGSSLSVSIVSALNSSQAYLSSNYAAQLYNNAPANAVQSRTFGTWTFLSSIIRLYAAYYISESHVYDLAMWTYGIAFAHFVSEWLIFGSAKAKGRFISPLFVASGSLLWMATQREWYSA
ncbi:hypothetical protein ACO22_02634 [Paracoccidioides brasiliensis]|uniref:Ergosterol biosynthetic protein 28 n=1 Tax=Paracoccidioides brasiliensis TaxID=121759 RepID=A0A1D2JII5_PARBR|nr:hypothetical protein ACO22_02634 [Paracoccidioides brasiliensis]